MVETDVIPALLKQAATEIASSRRFPEATYRVQLHAGFTFRDACRIIPYLHDLGITDFYASPYLKARAGSQHGYDIMDHRVLNPEIGGEEDYAAFVYALQTRGMGQLLDTVPNHMGIVGNENAWWNDVLENGPSSPYAGFFDIEWHPIKPILNEKVLVPVLGDQYGKVLESQQLSLAYENGAFAAHYFDHRFPIAPETGQKVLRHRLPELEQRLGPESEQFIEYQSILTALSHLPPRSVTDAARVAERHREKEVIKRRLAALVEASAPVREFVDENVALFNGREGDPHSFDLLDDLLNDQAYRLASWRVASDEINYRRFFDINELAALSAEKLEVFLATHELILRLLGEGKVTGLRIDHPDGLYDPQEYLERLQRYYVLERVRRIAATDPAYAGLDWAKLEGPLLEAIRRAGGDGAAAPFRRPLYVVVEKILEPSEPLPEHWPIYGTTGYTFLNMLNGLFVDPSQAGTCSRIFHRWTGMDPAFHNYVYEKKFLILQVSLAAELHVLAHQLDRLSQKNRWSRDFTLNSLRHALREIIACFPVYRSYIRDEAVLERDRHFVETAVAGAKQKNPAISASLFDFVRDVLLLEYPETARAQDRAEQRRFVGKSQQVTGPVMAKGLEDTAFYVYNRLVALNEVGGDPGHFGVPVAEFHQYNEERQKHWPYALSATSTHDTKRSEDVRTRIDVLSEIPKEWGQALTRWNRLNKRHHVTTHDTVAPDHNDAYLFYQTLVGAWPLGPCTGPAHDELVRRIQQYMQKAAHEAKVHTSWINPNPAYDEALSRFVARALDEKKNRRFLEDFCAFHQRLSHVGMFNSLSQTLLKIMSPGVPDIYQGTELWDFSLVDPDNRRPVDYSLRQRLLQEVRAGGEGAGDGPAAFARRLVESKEDGRVKLYVTYRALHARRDHPGLFSRGEYLPADALGNRAEHVCAFVRRLDKEVAVVAAPRLVAGLLSGAGDAPVGEKVWQDTALFLPGVGVGQRLRNLFTGEVVRAREQNGQAVVRLAELLAGFPVALLLAQD